MADSKRLNIIISAQNKTQTVFDQIKRNAGTLEKSIDKATSGTAAGSGVSKSLTQVSETAERASKKLTAMKTVQEEVQQAAAIPADAIDSAETYANAIEDTGRKASEAAYSLAELRKQRNALTKEVDAGAKMNLFVPEYQSTLEEIVKVNEQLAKMYEFKNPPEGIEELEQKLASLNERLESMREGGRNFDMSGLVINRSGDSGANSGANYDMSAGIDDAIDDENELTNAVELTKEQIQAMAEQFRRAEAAMAGTLDNTNTTGTAQAAQEVAQEIRDTADATETAKDRLDEYAEAQARVIQLEEQREAVAARLAEANAAMSDSIGFDDETGESFVADQSAYEEAKETFANMREELQLIDEQLQDARESMAEFADVSIDSGNTATNAITQSAGATNAWRTAGRVATTVMRGVQSAIRQVAQAARRFVSDIKAVGRAVAQVFTGAIQKASGAFGSLIRRFASGVPLLKRFNGETRHTDVNFKRLFTTLLKYGFGIRSIYFLFRRLRSAAVEGFQALAQSDEQTNASISRIITAVNQLKGAFATAFAPILQIVEPVITRVVQILSGATDAFGQVVAALTGRTQYQKASAVYKDYAKSLDKGTSSTKKATKANEELKRSIMAFDEINKLDSQSSAGVDTDTGTGSNETPIAKFDLKPIESKWKDFAKKLRDMWKNADFYDLGKMLGEKLNKALESIPWDKIRATANKIGKSLGTLINGFVESVNWPLVGRTLAQGINTVFEFLNGLGHELHFDSIGEAIGGFINGLMDLDWDLIEDTVQTWAKGIADAINSLVTTVDWAGVGETIHNALGVILDGFTTFFRELDFTELGHALRDTIANIDFVDLTNKLCDGFLELFKGVVDFVRGLFDDFDVEQASQTVQQIFGKIGSTIKEALDYIDWEELGQGVQAGLSLVFDAIGSFFEGLDPTSLVQHISDFFSGLFDGVSPEDLYQKITEIIGNISDFILTAAEQIDWETVGEYIHAALAGLIDGIGGFLSSDRLSTIISDFLEGLNVLDLISRFISNTISSIGNLISTLVGNGLGDVFFSAIGAKIFGSIGAALGMFFGPGGSLLFGLIGTIFGALLGLCVDDLMELANAIGEGINGLIGIVTEELDILVTDITNWAENTWSDLTSIANDLAGWFTSLPDKIIPIVQGAWNTITETVTGWANGLWESLKGIWDSIAGWFAETFGGIPQKISEVVGGIKDKVGSVWGSVKSGAKGVLDFLNPFKADGGYYRHGTWRPITAAAGGGEFDYGQMFIAREAGPELVGSIGGGTGVMNNDQIVASVSQGVFEAVSSAMAQYSAQNTGAGAPTIEVTLRADNETLYRQVMKGKQISSQRYGATVDI